MDDDGPKFVLPGSPAGLHVSVLPELDFVQTDEVEEPAVVVVGAVSCLSINEGIEGSGATAGGVAVPVLASSVAARWRLLSISAAFAADAAAAAWLVREVPPHGIADRLAPGVRLVKLLSCLSIWYPRSLAVCKTSPI